MGLEDRKARVLRAVVHDFIKTAEPVGSKTLAERYSLGVSSATIRNELAALEEQGYLRHPHTSAGRIPTDLGYRYYVDSLSGVAELARAQEAAIARYFEGVADLEETLERTSALLSSLTRYTAMVSPPVLDRSRLRRVELLGLGASAALLVLIMDTGRVEKRMISLPAEATEADLLDLRATLNRELFGQRLDRSAVILARAVAAIPAAQRALFDAVVGAIEQALGAQASDRIYLGGRARIAGPGAFDGIETVRAVYEALEQQVLMVHLLQMAFASDRVSVTIGSEHSTPGMESCSLVSASYVAGGSAGSIGVLGPTRMDYLGAMAAVQAVARYLGDLLDDVQP